jgi:hypothetical protein
VKKTFGFALMLCLTLSACGSGNNEEISALREQVERLQLELDGAESAGPTIPKDKPLIPAPPTSESSDTPFNIIRNEWITPDDSIDKSGMTLYWQSNFNNSPDKNAILSIYTNAEKLDDGEFGFDCGNDWLVIMETSWGHYPLFPRKHVQHGDVNCEVYYAWGGDNYDVFHVLITVRYGTAYVIYKCIFDNDREAFRIIPVYSAMNINPAGSSHTR